jgi:tetratricopeptide (TPR) repeat protein
MPRVQLFLSTVSAEFLSYRERLRHLLTRPDVEVKVQEDFIVTGDETLEMLDRYIQGCDGVIHLVGDMTGAMAKPQSVEAIAKRYPELASRFPLGEFLQPEGPSLSYTQWEAWLALHHGKPLFIATPEAGAPRDVRHVREAGQQDLQRAHLSRLRGVERYPGAVFKGQEHLAVEVLRSFVLDLLKKAGVSPNLYAPHNLPDRTTSPDRFVGRAKELKALAELLAPEGSRVYLTGMGGVGKSELALQHAYNALEHYSGGIVRLDARQGLVAMASQVVSFVRGTFPAVNLPEDQSKSPIELLALCWSQWPAGATPPEPVLLILDDQRGDAEGYAAERQLLAGLPPRFRRLLTQREPAPTSAKAIDLPLLRREASLELLALQAGEGGPERLKAESQPADGLCAEVGDLPLALVLLGARLAERPDLRLGQLLVELRAKGAEAKALQQAHPELGAQRGVVEALLISWEPLSAAAKSLGVLLGVMAPAVIPWELVEACRLPEQEVEEGSAFGEPQSELWRAQLLERLGEGRYRLHPLVRQFIRLQSRELEEVVGRWRRQLAAVVAEICSERIPQTLTLAQVEALEPVLPHIRQVAEHCAGELSAEDLIGPFTGLARVAEHQALFAEALRWYEQGLTECEQRLGPEHPGTASALINLAALLQVTNRMAEAEPLMRRALAIDEACCGNDHPKMAIDLNNLAHLLQATNRLSEAEPLMARVVEIFEISYGKDHPKVATALNNLAQLLQATNRLPEAEPLMRRALAIDEASYGDDHPNVAIRLNNLAQLLQATNRLEEAEPLMRRAVAIDEASFGNDHPDVAIDLNNLAQLLQVTNRLSEAEPLMRRALAIDEASYGNDHPNVARDLNNLAGLLKATNRLAEAEPLMHRVLAIGEASYGKDHPNVATALNNLAGLLQVTNRLSEAEPLMRRALAIDEVSYGTNHPDVAIDLNNLAQLLQVTNRLSEAEPLMRRALAIDEASYGNDHPRVARDLNNLAGLLKSTNRLSEAEPLMRRAVAIDEASYGNDHPMVAIHLNNLAQLLQATNRLSEAEPLMRRALAIDEASYGNDHPSVAIRHNNLAALLQATNRLAEAEPLMARVVEIFEISYGKDHPNVATALNNLAQLLQATNRLSEAEPLMRQMVEIFIAFQKQGFQHPNFEAGLHNYLSLLQTQGLSESEIKSKLQTLLQPISPPAL